MYTPRFAITLKTLENVARIQAAAEVIGETPLINAYAARLREEAMREEIRFGLRQEGGGEEVLVERVWQAQPLRSESAAQVGQRIGVEGRERQIREIMNYMNVLKIVDQWVVMNQKQGGEFAFEKGQLLTIQSLMLEKVTEEEELGRWRRVQISQKGRANALYRPANAVEVPYQIDDLFLWLRSREVRELHPVLKAAIVEFELMRILPFASGNERISSVLVSLMLAVEGINGERFLSMAGQRAEGVADYFEMMMKAEKAGELSGWIEWWSGLLLSAIETVRTKVRKVAVDSMVRTKVGQQIALSDRQIRLLQFLEAREWSEMGQIRELLKEVSDDTILRDLRDLLKKQLIKKQGRTKGVRYALKKTL